MEQASSNVETKNVVNGVNVDELFGTIDAVKETPAIGEFRFKANNKWVNGGLNKTKIDDFYGTQKDLSHKKPFLLEADEPPLLLGEDQGPNPVEYALTALAACVTTSIVYHAAARGIELKSVESKLEGDIDLRGFLGISEEVSPGYKGIRMNFKIDSDAPAEQLRELMKFAPNHSPVYRTITGAVPVSVNLEE
jgi:uncharacterized OsmC-like protein